MAPMVDLSHAPYRELVRGFTGCDRFYSEMLNSRIVPTENPARSVYLKCKETGDLILQLVGNDPERMQAAAARLDTFAPWGIDINMGCYLKKITSHGWGVALMRDIDLARRIAAAVRDVTHRPLSVKLRIGYALDAAYLIDFALMLQATGVDFLVLHARTAQDGLTRKARWEYIAAVKERLRIPVIGNGDIKSPQDALTMLRQTGCDGVMIGRQALVQPWIFRDIKALLAGTEIQPAPPIREVMLGLSRRIAEHFPPDLALKRFKLAVGWLAMNLQFGHHLAKEVNRAASLDDAGACIHKLFATGMS